MSALRAGVQAFFASAKLANTLATASLGLGVFAFALHRIIGWPGLIAMLTTLVLLSLASLLARREGIEWVGLLPISLLVFVGWATLSLFWSQYDPATFGGVAYLIGFTVLGVCMALARDTIQLIRIIGDVARFALTLSLALEVLSGLLIDLPIPFLAIDGHLDEGGPISGVLGSRNELGLLAVVALISFVIELRTRSVSRSLGIGSMVLGTVVLLLTGSALAWGTAVVAVVAAATLYGLRRIEPASRMFWQYAALALAAGLALTAWLFRSPLVEAANAGGELSYRLKLWDQMWSLIQVRPLEGWGWTGLWQSERAPFRFMGDPAARESTSGVNAYLDVWLQLGFIGLASFLLLAGLAFVRSWLLAARQRSVVYTWPATVLAALLVGSLAESTVLVEFGWLIFVLCCVKASQNLSWRTAFRRPLEPDVG